MCMDRTYTVERKQEYFDKWNEWVPVKKVVQIRRGKKYYYARYYDATKFTAGLNNSRTSLDRLLRLGPIYLSCAYEGRYASGFHFYYISYCEQTSYLGDDHRGNRELCITCYVKKSWITEIGCILSDTVIVASKAIFPKFPAIYLTDLEKRKYGIVKCV